MVNVLFIIALIFFASVSNQTRAFRCGVSPHSYQSQTVKRVNIVPPLGLGVKLFFVDSMNGASVLSFLPSSKPKYKLKSYAIAVLADASAEISARSPVVGGSKIYLKQRLMQDMKEAMKNKEKTKLSAIRSIQSAIKQKEVDDRIEVDDDMAIGIMSKLIKQRKESIQNFIAGERDDLASIEQDECLVIQSYLPEQMSEVEIDGIINDAIERLNASSIKDMGKVMADIKLLLTGKADMSQVGSLLKKKLGGK